MLKINLGKHVGSNLDKVFENDEYIIIYCNAYKHKTVLYYPFIYNQLPTIIYYQKEGNWWHELISNYKVSLPGIIN